jgi:serine/threonine-protein kinase
MTIAGRGERVAQVLAGRYRLESLLGAGGMGEVYKARRSDNGAEVAIKILRREHASDPMLVTRFLREARAARIVHHPNVVEVLDIGQDSDGTPFIVHELLRGEDLARSLKAIGRTLSAGLALDLIIPIVDAVATAHANGVVHRDLKPGNIFLARIDKRRTPKLLDFGISHLASTSDMSRITSTGTSLGTPAYMSPEQVMAFKELDARTDVWSLGVILYELVAGRLPFLNGDTPGALYVQICATDPTPLEKAAPGVPRDYARVVARCLRREREERYPSAKELLQDLKNVRDGHPLVPLPGEIEISLGPPTARVEVDTVIGGAIERLSDMPTVSLKTPPAVLPVGALAPPPPDGLDATEKDSVPPPSDSEVREIEPGQQVALRLATVLPRRIRTSPALTPLRIPPELRAYMPVESRIPPSSSSMMGSRLIDLGIGFAGCLGVLLVPWQEHTAVLGRTIDVPRFVVMVLAAALGVAAAVRGARRAPISGGQLIAALGFIALALSAGVETFAAHDFPSLPGMVVPWATLSAALGCSGVGLREARAALRKKRTVEGIAAVVLALAALALCALIAWRNGVALGIV